MIKAVLNVKKKKKVWITQRYSVLDLICELKQSTYSLGGGQDMWPQREEVSVQSWEGYLHRQPPLLNKSWDPWTLSVSLTDPALTQVLLYPFSDYHQCSLIPVYMQFCCYTNNLVYCCSVSVVYHICCKVQKYATRAKRCKKIWKRHFWEDCCTKPVTEAT